MEISFEKTSLPTWGLEPASLVISQQPCYPIDHHVNGQYRLHYGILTTSLSHSCFMPLCINVWIKNLIIIIYEESVPFIVLPLDTLILELPI